MGTRVKLKIVLAAAAAVPVAVAALAYGDLADPRFGAAAALGLASAFVIALLLDGAAARWVFGGGFKLLAASVAAVKRGRFDELPRLPVEAADGDEDEFLAACRSLDWMAHRVALRERELRESIAELAAANERLISRDRALRSANTRLSVLSRTDPLTGLSNRRLFFSRLEQSLRQADGSLSLLLLDIDHFKKVNDAYGHQAGDAALVDIASVLGSSVRKTDTAARVGGEEFAVLLEGAAAEDARALAECILDRVRSHAVPLPGGGPLRLTCSIGLFSADRPIDLSAAEAYRRADQSLYRAKSAGRDRLCRFSMNESVCLEQPSA